jgi:hypothetical protein
MLFFLVVTPPIQPQIVDPCLPTPCGPNSVCQVTNEKATCGCMANMIGTAPNCRPECVVNSDCPSNRACVNQKCTDPCPGSCGFNADCRVANHQPVCACQPKFTGDPYSSCRPIPVGKSYNTLFWWWEQKKDSERNLKSQNKFNPILKKSPFSCL